MFKLELVYKRIVAHLLLVVMQRKVGIKLQSQRWLKQIKSKQHIGFLTKLLKAYLHCMMLQNPCYRVGTLYSWSCAG